MADGSLQPLIRTVARIRATLAWAARKATTYLDELGLIAGPGRALWARAGLL